MVACEPNAFVAIRRWFNRVKNEGRSFCLRAMSTPENVNW